MGNRLKQRAPSWRQRFVAAIYATHNRSAEVQHNLRRCLESAGPITCGLEVGAGSNRLHPALITLNLVPAPGVDICADAESLPFPDGVFDVVVSQEVLEHVRDPFRAMREMQRVLKPRGLIYCQLPFVIGYHPGPTDFWRFTREGIRELVDQAGLRCYDIKVAAGIGTAFYRIAVEFLAILVSRFATSLYLPAKGAFALLLYPMKWLDPVLAGSAQSDRIPGGYLIIAGRS
jgi:SAM-dependent methyltransferase